MRELLAESIFIVEPFSFFNSYYDHNLKFQASSVLSNTSYTEMQIFLGFI